MDISTQLVSNQNCKGHPTNTDKLNSPRLYEQIEGANLPVHSSLGVLGCWKAENQSFPIDSILCHWQLLFHNADC